MKKCFIETGKIVGTHGIRGMVRIQPWADSADFLSPFKTLYTDGGKTSLKIKRIQPHGNMAIAEIEGVDSIEKAETLRNKVLCFSRHDAQIPEGRYFISELIGCKVSDAQSGREYGILSDVSSTGANDVWHIKNGEKEYLLPAIAEVIKKVDINSETIEICPMKGIFNDEN